MKQKMMPRKGLSPAKRYKPYALRVMPGDGQPFMRTVFSCETQGCSGEVAAGRLRKGRSRHCPSCVDASHTLNGFIVKDEWIWRHRDRFSHSTYKGAQVTHHMRCETPECPSTLHASSIKRTGKWRCLKCVGASHRRPMWALLHARLCARKVPGGCTLTEEQVSSLMQAKACGYCLSALPSRLGYASQPKGEGQSTAPMLDRMDNLRGYAPGNVVPCCWSCNTLKSDKLSPLESLVLNLARCGRYSSAARAMRCSSYLEALTAIKESVLRVEAKRLLVMLQGLT